MEITKVSYHRNGVSGEGFFAVTFNDKEHGPMFAVVFETSRHVAVFRRDLIGAGVIEFGQNSWRGDHFENDLRAAIKKATADRTIV